MGQWTLVVQGQGTHHNGGAPFDADVISKQIAPLFEGHGHIIDSVQLTVGGREQVIAEAAVEDDAVVGSAGAAPP